MQEQYWIKDVVLIFVIYELVSTAYSCIYIVESRTVNERAIEWEYPTAASNKCEIATRLKGRWALLERPKERIRIRGNAMVVKYGAQNVKYRCMESRGHTFLLGTTSYLGNRHGVLCLGFVENTNNKPQVAEYSVVRLNGHGFERHLLSPQLISMSSNQFPTLNETCVLTGVDQNYYAYIRRTERRCVFPDELHRAWNYTFHSVRHVTFAHKTFTLTLMNDTRFRFNCNVNDGDLYVFRSPELLSPKLDGIVCFNITNMAADPHYKYEMSRLNSGDTLEGMVKPFPVGKPVAMYDDCDWIDSPARPEYLY